jgi:hypothetical protein
MEEAVVGEDLLGGAFAFGAEPELGALVPGALWTEYGGGEGNVVNGFILLASVAKVHIKSSGFDLGV